MRLKFSELVSRMRAITVDVLRSRVKVVQSNAVLPMAANAPLAMKSLKIPTLFLVSTQRFRHFPILSLQTKLCVFCSELSDSLAVKLVECVGCFGQPRSERRVSCAAHTVVRFCWRPILEQPNAWSVRSPLCPKHMACVSIRDDHLAGSLISMWLV